ncbi:hypothetical protein [Streptomyces sp. NBC_00691]|uniref:hypothetical protein n=1 Tax=Streptomyces sp. NBC_00691 TaxID=2903671 RepID=UPI002E34B100|nr:hypothetical protein [Streptomyces sp. NBC_00691]
MTARVVPALMLPVAVLMAAAPAQAASPIPGVDVHSYAKSIAETTTSVLSSFSLISEAGERPVKR